VSMSDELKERNILKLILIMRFACATLDMIHPIVDVSQGPGLTFDFVKPLMWYSARSILGAVFHTVDLRLVSSL
jgi:hypothetical protein